MTSNTRINWISGIATDIRFIRVPEVTVGYPINSDNEKNPARPEHPDPPSTPLIFSKYFGAVWEDIQKNVSWFNKLLLINK